MHYTCSKPLVIICSEARISLLYWLFIRIVLKQKHLKDWERILLKNIPNSFKACLYYSQIEIYLNLVYSKEKLQILYCVVTSFAWF